MPATTKLKLSDVQILSRNQPRAKMDAATVAEYAELIQAGVELPPITVFHDKAEDIYVLADGFHRFDAHSQLNKKAVDCIVRKGTAREAQLFALGCNADHGLRRTNADKRRVVEIMLKDEEWSKMSDRAIAKQCVVSNTMVSEIRAELNGAAKKTKKTGTKEGSAAAPAEAAQDAPPPPEDGDSSQPHADPAPAQPTQCDHGKPFDAECPDCIAALEQLRNGEDQPPPDLSETPGKDARGRDCPAELATVFAESNSVLSTLERELHALKRRITEFGATPAGAALRVQQIDIDMGNVARAVRFGRAFTTCPNHPNCANGCNTCKGRGWVVKDEFDRLPAEMKG